MLEQEKPSAATAVVQYKLAAIWQARGNFARALAGYEQAIQLQPDYLPAYIEMGQLLARLGQLEKAQAIYQRAILLNPAERGLKQRLGELTRNQDDAPQFRVTTSDNACYPTGRPHIVVYSDCSGIGGVAQCNHTLIMALLAASYKVTAVLPVATNQLIVEQQQAGVCHVWLTDDNIYDLDKPARQLLDHAEPRAILTVARPDGVIFADGMPFSNLTAKEVAGELGIPFVTITHCVTEQWANQYAPFLERLSHTYEQAMAVVAVSRSNLEQLRRSFALPKDKGQVIYNGRPASFFAPPNVAIRQRLRQQLAIADDGIIVCTVAAMEMRKGYQFLARAIKRLRQKAFWPKLYFVWVGSGTLEAQLRAIVANCDAGSQVRFLGEHLDIAHLLDAADVFALPSLYEGMPLSVMEAMARGKAVVASGVSGIPEELGDSGKLLPDPGQWPEEAVSELIATIETWTIDAGKRQAAGAAAQRRAQALFTEQRMQQEYMNLIRPIFSASFWPEKQDGVGNTDTK